MTRALLPGVYVPLPAFFNEKDELDLESYKKHAIHVAQGGAWPVVSGTMGEAVHLDRAERVALIRTAREALDSAGLVDGPVIAGAGAPSTRESIQIAKEAAEAGADFVIVIPPGYFAGVLTKNGGAALKKYFVDIAEASPVPLLMYNFPAVTGGIDLDTDLIEEIARSSSNVVGIKLTCGGVGKISRLTGLTKSKEFVEKYPRKQASAPFSVFDGFVDMLLPSILGADGAGTITGLANIAPLSCSKLWELCKAEPTPANIVEAQKLQALVSRADWVTTKAGIAGTKYLLNHMFRYPAAPRLPLPPTTEEAGQALLKDPTVIEILALEKSLAEEKTAQK